MANLYDIETPGQEYVPIKICTFVIDVKDVIPVQELCHNDRHVTQKNWTVKVYKLRNLRNLITVLFCCQEMSLKSETSIESVYRITVLVANVPKKLQSRVFRLFSVRFTEIRAVINRLYSSSSCKNSTKFQNVRHATESIQLYRDMRIGILGFNLRIYNRFQV